MSLVAVDDCKHDEPCRQRDDRYKQQPANQPSQAPQLRFDGRCRFSFVHATSIPLQPPCRLETLVPICRLAGSPRLQQSRTLVDCGPKHGGKVTWSPIEEEKRLDISAHPSMAPIICLVSVSTPVSPYFLALQPMTPPITPPMARPGTVPYGLDRKPSAAAFSFGLVDITAVTIRNTSRGPAKKPIRAPIRVFCMVPPLHPPASCVDA